MRDTDITVNDSGHSPMLKQIAHIGLYLSFGVAILAFLSATDGYNKVFLDARAKPASVNRVTPAAFRERAAARARIDTRTTGERKEKARDGSRLAA